MVFSFLTAFVKAIYNVNKRILERSRRMEHFKKHPLYRFRWLIFVLPYFLALAGYIQLYFIEDHFNDVNTKYLVLAAFYNSFKIYGMSVSADLNQMNMWFEVARLGGGLVTTSVIVKVAKFIMEKLRTWRMVRKPDTLVVHGDGALQKTLLQTLGTNSIAANGEMCFQAKQHVLAFDQDAQALRYIMKHEKDFLSTDKITYFLSTGYEASDYGENGVIVSNIAANCARLYWAEHWLKDPNIRRVAIIGFGHYGERLLEQALLVNVLPWRDSIEYHIFGSDGKNYLSWHPQLINCLSINQSDETKDSVHFHPLVPEDIRLLQQMNRIIIAMDDVDENLLLLDRLLHTGMNGIIHVRCGEDLLTHLQYIPRRQYTNPHLQVKAFGSNEQLFSQDVILHGQLLQSAKENHRMYVAQSQAENIYCKYFSCQNYANCLHQGYCGQCLHAAATWDDLTPFEKASNIAAADHAPIKQTLLKVADQHSSIKDCKDSLCRTEHIRWCRFYYLHNWAYAETRDDHRRFHPLLQPFDQLSPSEQDKDWWPYELLLQQPYDEK